jgi:tRNA A-37 threonylcarbamoyl transferase component Bud32/CheY-like chemotaxis protein
MHADLARNLAAHPSLLGQDHLAMPEIDLESLVDQLTLIGVVSRDQYREARAEAEDGSPEALIRVLTRKGWLTSWQLERLKKGDLSGFFFGSYRALFHLAEGTFARVYRGMHNDTGSPAAIKVLRNRYASIAEAVLRFHKEAEAGMRLRHQNIVQVVDQGQQDNRHYLIMEYVEGMNLREFLRLRVRLKDREALPLLLGLAYGLQYSHEQGVTHRDLKATNILISNSGTAKLVDFGLATIEGDDSRHHVHSQRTVDYSALERTCGSPKGDARSDIYFLGCVFYHLLTGQVPLEDSESKDPLKKMLKRSFGSIRPISEHNHAPAEHLAHIIEKMMKMELKARYQNMNEVVSDLEDYQVTIDSAAADARAFARKYETPPEAEAEAAPEAQAVPASPVSDQLLTEERGEVFEPGQHEVKALSVHSLLCVEAQAEIQDALRKNLARMGYRVLLVADAERAAERYQEAPTDAVIFDFDGLGSEAMTAFNDMNEKAQEEGKPLVALVLLGPRQGAIKDALPMEAETLVLSKPIKLKEVQDAITRLMPVR